MARHGRSTRFNLRCQVSMLEKKAEPECITSRGTQQKLTHTQNLIGIGLVVVVRVAIVEVQVPRVGRIVGDRRSRRQQRHSA